MQNRYVGDVGDFVKLSLLRALLPGYQLGIVWYLVPDELHNRDGRHISYLRDEEFGRLNPRLFASLGQIVENGQRSVFALERECAFENCIYVSDSLPLPRAHRERQSARAAWVKKSSESVSNCNLIFLDPDNGLEPERFKVGRKKAIKSVSFADLSSFNKQGRTIIVYHHHTRRNGGHLAELGYNADRLRNTGFERVDAIRASRYSARAFFILNATEEIRERARAFANAWKAQGVKWHENPTIDKASSDLN